MNASPLSGSDPQDAFDELLNEFKNRNKARTSPEYVLETMNTDSISDKYIRLLRNPSAVNEDLDVKETLVEVAETVSTDTDSTKGLAVLSENYTKSAQTKDQLSSFFGIAAIAVLIVGVVVLAAMAQAILLGIVIVLCAVALWIVRAVTARQAKATREIASALVETEEQ
ncbi:hypothetical protein AINA4_05720 [Aurantimicrobium sp. INA4]|uniref:hypothetical protein n=1 Tax=Aurantimicrobium sp. INA4 TaxID=2986279 RepID=UPI00248FAA4D|nr:hypothetical protein [Aurantimicrobium sp. INA4]BDU10651.1 hypothetical protein AINA4_05720 [Aurantimicrobium sp. INA4]